MNFLLRFLITSLIGYLLIRYMPGREVRDEAAALMASVFVSLLNSAVNPRRVVRTQPITLFTLALILIALGFLLLKVGDRYIPGFDLHDWRYGLLVAAAMTVVSFVVDRLITSEKKTK